LNFNKSKSRRNLYKRRSLQRSLPTSWFRDELFTERESEFLKSIKLTESIPQASAAISIPKIPETLKSIFHSSPLVSSSVPNTYRFNKKFSSYDLPIPSTLTSASSSHALNREPRHLVNDIRHQLRSRLSEPNLLSKYDYGCKGAVNNQTIVISNQTGNKIILKSSFSDQNLTANINAGNKMFNCSVQYSDDPIILPLDPLPLIYNEEKANSIISSSSSSSRGFRRRRLPNIPLPARNTQSLYLPTFETIPSIESDAGSYEISPISSRFGKSLSADETNEDMCNLSESYLKSEDESASLRRSYSLIAEEQIIDVEYDSDTGWVTKNVRKNPLKKIEKVKDTKKPQRERSYSRENLKLDLKLANKPKSPTIIHNADDNGKKRDKSITNSGNDEMKNIESNDNDDVVDTIGSIINNVRSQLLLSQSDACNEETFDVQEERRSSLKIELEGKVVSPKINDSTSGSTKYVCEKAIGFENENPFSDAKKNTNVFQKCLSRSSQGSTDAKSDEDNDEEDETVDDVFEKRSFSRDKNASFHAKDRKTVPSHRRSSSLEGIPKKSSVRNCSTGSKSSVSINDNPEYFEYSIPSKITKSSKIASSNAIAKLNTKPKRGSLKKSTSSPKPKKSPRNSSDYDRRTRNLEGGHRESFKKNDRTNERNSEQDRDASDRELKDGNLNRSLSNTDTNIEDRIGEFMRHEPVCFHSNLSKSF